MNFIEYQYCIVLYINSSKCIDCHNLIITKYLFLYLRILFNFIIPIIKNQLISCNYINFVICV